MKIKNHKLVGETFTSTKNMGGTIDPKFIIMHYTAGWSDESAIQAFKNRKVSAQIVLARDGTITQMVPFNRRAWHAGPSKFNGYKNINSHSIGIEVVNIGYFRKLHSGKWEDPYGGIHDEASLKRKGYNSDDFLMVRNPRLGSGDFYWPAYTQAQYDALDKIIPALIEEYDIQDIGTHEEIDTRGWKTDIGPNFAMKRYENMLNGGRFDRSDDQDDDVLYRVKITTHSLNVRSGAGTKWRVFDSLKRNNQVSVIDSEGSWLFIRKDSGEEGWIHGRYTDRV